MKGHLIDKNSDPLLVGSLSESKKGAEICLAGIIIPSRSTKKGNFYKVRMAIEGLGEGGADILNAAGESIGNIFDTFVSPVLYAIQWILIISIILYLLKLRSENRENVMVRNRWDTANNINTGGL